MINYPHIYIYLFMNLVQFWLFLLFWFSTFFGSRCMCLSKPTLIYVDKFVSVHSAGPGKKSRKHVLPAFNSITNISAQKNVVNHFSSIG